MMTSLERAILALVMIVMAGLGGLAWAADNGRGGFSAAGYGSKALFPTGGGGYDVAWPAGGGGFDEQVATGNSETVVSAGPSPR